MHLAAPTAPEPPGAPRAARAAAAPPPPARAAPPRRRPRAPWSPSPRCVPPARAAARANAAPGATAAPAAASDRAVPADFTYTSPDGRWRVRLLERADADEVRAAVALQIEGFHVRHPLPPLDHLLRRAFAAEVLDEMRRKLRFGVDERFACLVAERASAGGGGGGAGAGARPEIIGVAEVSYLDVAEILRALDPGTERFSYVASMAVAPAARRAGVARALLGAAERVAARHWRDAQACLHVYQDNAPAIAAYAAAGYEAIYADAAWLRYVAMRPRLLMRRRLAPPPPGAPEP
jgi:ribosomal protein S18 acetylase RimI-like enzyme